MQWRLRNLLVVSSISAIWEGLMVEENALKPNHCLHKPTCIKNMYIFCDIGRIEPVSATREKTVDANKETEMMRETQGCKERMKKKNEDRRRIISKEYSSNIKAVQICKPKPDEKREKKNDHIRYLLHELGEIIIYQHWESAKKVKPT